jgi:hypothetical protein
VNDLSRRGTASHEGRRGRRGPTAAPFNERRRTIKERKNDGNIAGLALHILIGGLLVFTGSEKVLGVVPPEALAKYGLGEQVRLIGVGALLTALLLVIRRTSSLGILFTSAFWGGAICIHMAHGEPYLFQAALLVLSWVGAYLRNPAMLRSFSDLPGNDVGGGLGVGAGHAVTGPGVERWPGLWHYENGAGI